MREKVEKGQLIEYVRDIFGNKCGIVIATDKNHIGWSLLHDYNDPNYYNYIEGHGFDRNRGLKEAKKRAALGLDWVEIITKKVCVPGGAERYTKLNMLMPYLLKMQDRVNNYYK